MKLFVVLASLIFLLAYVQAQSSCRGSIPKVSQSCVGGLNEGHNRENHCSRNANRNMWYFDTVSRSCFQMSYRGCGGNNNRFCTLDDCRWQCRRSRA